MSFELLLISGNANRPLAEEVAKYLNLKLADVSIKKFSDGEISVKINENIRGKDVFIIQPTSAPANDHIMELLLTVDAVRRASAKRITVVIPYYGYGRQDRKSEPRVPISARVIADILQVTGPDRVLTVDLHADQIQGFFHIPVDNIYAAPVFINYIKNKQFEAPVVISPDTGGVERARYVARHIEANLAIIDKRRPQPNDAEIMNVIGDVEGRECIIYDDIIDTAGTITKAARALKEKGAKKVIACATHAVLSGNAIEKLQNSELDEVVFTNTIYLPPEKRIPKIVVLSIAVLLGESIRRIHNEESISSLFL
ncbi:MAG: ribose-phosphate pyrophosphokinase [Leptospiraceae bacterium]|nr:ribose-phosphate pyrophosphokinase [Leptospiraceae bacterium]MDW7975490.1 ribose-phosphate pyrophosphokinase [Leptospiraceae bacterium]